LTQLDATFFDLKVKKLVFWGENFQTLRWQSQANPNQAAKKLPDPSCDKNSDPDPSLVISLNQQFKIK